MGQFNYVDGETKGKILGNTKKRNFLHKQLRCEHGLAGCIMPGYHLPEECHTAEMLEQQFSEDVKS